MKNITRDYAVVNGLKMYYEIHGEGEPLVLIHGGGSTIQSTFGNIMPLLARHNKVIAVELQAHGRTSDRPTPESFEQDADDVAALLQHLKTGKANIIGFSNGGNTREGMMPGFFDGLKGATLDNMPAQLKTAYLGVNNNRQGLQTMFEKDKTRMLSFADWDDSQLKSITVPTLVMSADQDVVQPAHALKMSQLIPRARLMILPGVHGSFIGEICSVEKESRLPELTVAVIEEFLKKI